MDPYDARDMRELKEEKSKSKLRAKLTWVIGGLLSFLGTAAAFLGGVDWSVLFTPEAAGLAGATVLFVRAFVTFVQRPKE